MQPRPLTQIARQLGCAEGPLAGWVGAVAIDSRQVQPGDLFFALKGQRTDGHLFLKEVALRGACAAVVQRGCAPSVAELPLIYVEDVLRSLQGLAGEELAAMGCRVVAVTGSVGKTTTKEFLATLLGTRYRVAKTQGNQNTQIGVPLSILGSRGDEELFVVEMGMSGPGQIARLVEVAPPDVALITKIALSHAQSFPEKGLQGIAEAKAEILSSARTKHAVIAAQAWQFAAVQRRCACEKTTYAVAVQNADVQLWQEEGGFVVKEGERTIGCCSLPFPEALHLCENFLGAAVGAHLLGVPWEEILHAARQLTPYQGRCSTRSQGGILFIDDSYNANPESMRSALCSLRAMRTEGRRIAVLGAMKELGPFCEESHREIGRLAAQVADLLLCYGRECLPMLEIFAQQGKGAHYFEELSQMQASLMRIAQPGDLVLVKGSASNQLQRLFGAVNK